MKFWAEQTVRDTEGGDILEVLLVSAVASLLAIRAFLALTGYPQLGGEGLHVAHMLWGGLFMLAALILLAGYWNPSVRGFAGFLGGVGFGTFIDELGKFITDDNDYFYQPTIALIYAIFVALFLTVRILYVYRPFTARELQVNAELRAVLRSEGENREAEPDLYRELRRKLASAYERLVLHPWFQTGIIALFVGVALSRVLTVVGVAVFGQHRGGETVEGIRALGSSLVGVFVVIGALRLRRSRLDALRWFQRSVLVSMLVVQFFVFLDSELAALGGLAADLLLYLALGLMIRAEQTVLGPSASAGRA